MNSPLNQLRENRRHALDSWLSGSTPTGEQRWPGDDGRIMTESDLLRMEGLIKLALSTPEQTAEWTVIIKAEKAYFSILDAQYEKAKSAL